MSVRLERVHEFALGLAEVTREPHFQYDSFRVRGRIFLTVPPDGERLHVFVGEDVREPALAMHRRCLEKLEWGGKVVGLRVMLKRADGPLVEQLVRAAWQARGGGATGKPPAKRSVRRRAAPKTKGG